MTIEFTILITKVNLFCIYKNVEFVIHTWPKVSTNNTHVLYNNAPRVIRRVEG